MEDERPDPDLLLKFVNLQNKKKSIGQLRIFIGMSAGVGKTYSMLSFAHQKIAEGFDVIIGTIDTHGRKETIEKLNGIPIIPRKKIEYRDIVLEEMDLEQILIRKPQIVLVDELAHTNAPTSRHPKRWQDVVEILENGIDVFSTVNIQHIESKKDVVETITDIVVHETVPDSILERANYIEVVDIPPEDLIKRLKDGKVYLEEKAEQAAVNFFKEDKLTALRQILLRLSADKVDVELQNLNSQKLKEKIWKTQEKILLAVGHGPQSKKLVRITKQMATNLRCPWYAVFIDTGKELSVEDRNTLTINLDLARELGGKIISTSEVDLVQGIDRVCRQYNITQVVLGRPNFQPIRNFIDGGSLIDRLNKLNNDVSIHLVRIGSKSTKQNIFEKISNLKNINYFQYFYASFYVFGIGIINRFIFLEFNLLPYRSIGMIFLLGVTFCGLFLPLGPTIWASLLTVQVWNVFFIPPLYTFIIESPDDIALAITFFFTAVITGALTSNVKKNQNLLRDQEERTTQLYKISQLIIESKNKEECINELINKLEDFLNVHVAISLKNENGILDYFKKGQDWMFNQPKEWAAAKWGFENNKISGKWTDTLPDSTAFFSPLFARNDVVGVIGICPKDQKQSLLIKDREFILSISSQIALYLQREIFHESAIEGEKLKKSEKLHQILLNSVSHEIKTPLTAISGFVDALSKFEKKDSDLYNQLSQGLQESVERLKRIVDNILDVSRIDSGILTLKEDWFSFEDLLDNVLDQFKDELNDFQIIKVIPENFPLIFVDGRMIEQVLYNLVLNSIKYSIDTKCIKIQLMSSKSEWKIIYEDKGIGIEDQYHRFVFDKFFRVPGSKPGGSGLGLAISKSIIELHKGNIKINKSTVGLIFEIVLPLKLSPELKAENL